MPLSERDYMRRDEPASTRRDQTSHALPPEHRSLWPAGIGLFLSMIWALWPFIVLFSFLIVLELFRRARGQ